MQHDGKQSVCGRGIEKLAQNGLRTRVEGVGVASVTLVSSEHRGRLPASGGILIVYTVSDGASYREHDDSEPAADSGVEPKVVGTHKPKKPRPKQG
jgi:hypothetical protein